jgi:hypothetical protein
MRLEFLWIDHFSRGWYKFFLRADMFFKSIIRLNIFIASVFYSHFIFACKYFLTRYITNLNQCLEKQTLYKFKCPDEKDEKLYK